MKAKKQEMNWKSRIRKLTRWRTKKEQRTNEKRWRTTKNLHGFVHGNISEALRKHLGLDFLHGNNFFHPKPLKCIASGIRDHWKIPFSPIYRKNGEEVVAQLAQASWVASSRSNPASKILWNAQIQNFENCYLHNPILISSPPFFRNLRKSYKSLTEAYRTWFSSFFLFHLTRIKLVMLI